MLRIGYVSSFAPRECGIATFTEDLTKSIDALHVLEPSRIIAINEPGAHYNYGNEVVMHIESDDLKTYRQAADRINRSNLDLVNVQHEFGLFGGKWGDHLLTFLRELKRPCVTTMHTTLASNSSVFDSPKSAATHTDVVKEIAKRSSAIVVMTKMAAKILEEDYGMNADKIRVIQHGSPAIPFVPSQPEKRALGLERRIVLSTFGLLSRGKGIESAIKALPYIIKDYPEICYLVIGATHPQVRQREGEKYRESLMSLVQSLGLEKNVKFHNRFLTQDELIQYLKATDIYICPYPNKDQLSSGTVTYAIAAGKAIVSTPFDYASEVLANGRGMLSKFESPESIAKSIKHLLKNPERKARMERLAYRYGQGMTWSSIASKYASLFDELVGREEGELYEVTLH